MLVSAMGSVSDSIYTSNFTKSSSSLYLAGNRDCANKQVYQPLSNSWNLSDIHTSIEERSGCHLQEWCGSKTDTYAPNDRPSIHKLQSNFHLSQHRISMVWDNNKSEKGNCQRFNHPQHYNHQAKRKENRHLSSLMET